ncbi:MAG TPA: glycosyltransferase family 4 protein [Thermoplasmata archaeon]|nr:glycosyltransferase family 4 protein [Thermoplasmata archaeon]
MHVTLVSGFDPTSGTIGGTRTYVEAVAAFLATKEIPHVTVRAGRREEHRPRESTVRVRRPGSSLHFLAALAASGKTLPIPNDTIVHVQRPDDAVPFLVAGHRKIVCTLHGNPGLWVPSRHGFVVSGAYWLAERFALQRAAGLIAVDSHTAAAYTAKLPRLQGKIRVIPNGVDTFRFRPMDRAGAKAKWDIREPALLYAGRLEPDKRVREIVEAFTGLASDRGILAIAGLGSERTALEQLGSGRRVRFLGRVDREDMPSLLNAVDAAVIFSDEGLSSFALEAIACGVPVVATPTGDMTDIVIPERTGYLVKDLGKLRRAMELILRGALEPSPDIAATVKSYSWDRVGHRLLDMYSGVWNGVAW